MQARRASASPAPLEGLLAEAGRLLATSLRLDETLRTVTRLAIPEFADWSAVDVLEPDGELRTVSSGHPDPAKDALLLALRGRMRRRSFPSVDPPRGTFEVIATGEPRVYEPPPPGELPLESDEERRLWEELAPVSLLIVPLKAGDEVIGTLAFLSTDPERRYDERDLPVAAELAERCAQAVRNAQVYEASESARALLDALFASAPIGMAFIDTELRYVLVNERMAAMNDAPPEAHAGRHILDVLGDRASEAAEVLQTIIRTGA